VLGVGKGSQASVALLVLAVVDADVRRLLVIAAETRDLVARAHARRLTPEELNASTRMLRSYRAYVEPTGRTNRPPRGNSCTSKSVPLSMPGALPLGTTSSTSCQIPVRDASGPGRFVHGSQ
jgi:pyruvate/2-oxoglutarate dehydrogenase complex dihydrolipoamide acyltransferase (E2) component